VIDVMAPSAGYLAACDARALGLTVVDMGGGRRQVSDGIDHCVGFDRVIPLGSVVEKGQPIARVHAASREQAQHAAAAMVLAYRIHEKEPVHSPVVIERITG